jgi:hypothetical protein
MAVLKLLWAWWKPIAHRIGNFQARVILVLFYFLLFAPFALGVKLLSDPLRLKARAAPEWLQRSRGEGDALAVARRQF